MNIKKDLKIVEGIEGYYFYHLSKSGKNMQPALCGNRNVMSTNCKISSWGKRTHIKERYCTECENKASDKQQKGDIYEHT